MVHGRGGEGEVDPPERARERERGRDGHQSFGAQRLGRAARPIATTDSPSAMMRNSPKRSGRWAASNRTRARRDRTSLGTARSTSAASAHRATRAGPVASPPISSSGPVTVTPTLNEFTGMWRKPRKHESREDDPQGEVRRTEQHPRIGISTGHGERHEQAAQPDREDADPVDGTLDVVGVGVDARADPGPPDRYEENQRSPDSGPRVIRMQEGGHLCDREHEDEVEEEFGPGRPAFPRASGSCAWP